MPAYRQRCPNCVGIVLRAERDHARHVRMAHEARIDAAACRDDARRERNIYLGLATNHYHGAGRPRKNAECTNATHRSAELEALKDAAALDRKVEEHERLSAECELVMNSLTPPGCILCAGTGFIHGNGSALIGGSGKTRNQYGVAS